MKTSCADIENVEKPLVFLVFREFADFGSLARLGSILEASWAVLERLGGVLESPGGILERLGGVLERLGGVLERLGAVLEPSWRCLEVSWSAVARVLSRRLQGCHIIVFFGAFLLFAGPFRPS